METPFKPGQDISMEDLAAQLRQPSGAAGKEVADTMYQSNLGMIRESIAVLSSKPGDALLELGHGNAHHLKGWLQMEPNAQYTGLECSELMQAEAIAYSEQEGLSERCRFLFYDGYKIPFEDNSFDRVLTVNTLYFWNEPTALLQELYRVLRPEGYCCIAFVDAQTMEQLPFTQYGFTKYDIARFTHLVAQTDFTIDAIHTRDEKVINKIGDPFHRNYYIALLQKK